MALNFLMPGDAEDWAGHLLREWFGGFDQTTHPGRDGEYWCWLADDLPASARPSEQAFDVRPEWSVVVKCVAHRDGVAYRCNARIAFGGSEVQCEFNRPVMSCAIDAALEVMVGFLRAHVRGMEDACGPRSTESPAAACARKDALGDAAALVRAQVEAWSEFPRDGRNVCHVGDILASRVLALAEPSR